MVPNIFICLKTNLENKTIPKNTFECIKCFVKFYIKKSNVLFYILYWKYEEIIKKVIKRQVFNEIAENVFINIFFVCHEVKYIQIN